MVISQIYESKNLIISVSCSVCGKETMKRVSPLLVIVKIWSDSIYFPS